MAKNLILLVGFCLAGGNASAGDAILSCKSIIENADRLKCFDSALESLGEQNQVDSPVATAETEKIEPPTPSGDVSNQETSVTPDHVIQGIIEKLANSDFEGALAEVKSAKAGKGLPLNDAQIEKLRTATSDAVSPLPGSATLENLAGYQILLVLEPDNQKYVTKVKFYEEAAVAEKTKYLRKLKKETDEFNGWTWYTHLNEPKYIDIRSRISVYIGKKDSQAPILRMKTVYTEDSWLFVSSVQVSIDGKISALTSGEFLRDNDSEIWEWLDETPNTSQLQLLRDIAVADSVVLRFQGQQYHNDKKLVAGDKIAIKEVLLAYDELKKLEN